MSVRTIEELITDLDRRDVRLRLEGDRLRLSVPKGALSDELEEELGERRPELVGYLESARAEAAAPPLEGIPRVLVELAAEGWYRSSAGPRSAGRLSFPAA